MGACSREISTLPVLAGCPGSGEYFFMVGADGGLGTGKYALRPASDIKACFLSAIKKDKIQVVVGVTEDGDGNIIMSNTSTQLVITRSGIIQGSVWVTATGPEMPQEADGVSTAYYGEPQYSGDEVTINFIQSFGDGDVVIVHLLYLG